MSKTARPRVIIATRIYWPEPAAASFRLRALAEALGKAGAKVSVLTVKLPRPKPSEGSAALTDAPQTAVVKNLGDDGAAGGPQPEHAIKRWPVKRDKNGYVRGYLNYMSFDIPLFIRLLAAKRPALVVCEPPPTTGAITRVACAIRRIPYVYYAADVWSDAAASSAPKPVVSALRAVESFAYRGAKAVIAVSEGVAERVEALGARRVRTVENGIDTEQFKPGLVRPEEAPEGKYFLYAGTASEWQGAVIFARAWQRIAARHPGVKMVFLGQGSEWPEIERMASEDPSIIARGLVAPQVAAAWVAGAMATVVSVKPGVGYDFAYPTKIFASLAAGTPVVFAGPGPAVVDIEESQLGLTSAWDEVAIAANLERVVGGKTRFEAAHLRQWVLDNRSLARTGRLAAAVCREIYGG